MNPNSANTIRATRPPRDAVFRKQTAIVASAAAPMHLLRMLQLPGPMYRHHMGIPKSRTNANPLGLSRVKVSAMIRRPSLFTSPLLTPMIATISTANAIVFIT